MRSPNNITSACTFSVVGLLISDPSSGRGDIESQGKRAAEGGGTVTSYLETTDGEGRSGWQGPLTGWLVYLLVSVKGVPGSHSDRCQEGAGQGGVK